MMHLSSPLWKPSDSRLMQSNIHQFQKSLIAKKFIRSFDYWELYRWSLDEPAKFWHEVSVHTGLKFSTEPSSILSLPDQGHKFIDVKWFEDSRLNYAENLLVDRPHDDICVIAISEGRQSVETITFGELIEKVARVANYLKNVGIKSGDCVAGFVSNTSETLISMLAVTSLGAVWSSCSPDFGSNAVIERFKQISPKLLFATKSYVYSEKLFSCASRIEEILSAIPSINHCILIQATDESSQCPEAACECIEFSELFTSHQSQNLEFEPVNFDHPLFVMYSSGTTGAPKCITHGAGGTLLQHKKELALHVDLKPGSRILYYTTCGWMMWNWMVSALSTKACLVLYDGNPMQSKHGDLWKIAEDYNLDVLGTSPKFLSTCEQLGIVPGKDYDLSSLKTLLSTGSPLLPAQYDWVYQNVSDNLHLASISGGTDIISCFMLGVPILPVFQGQIQAPGLGMAVECWDDDKKHQVGCKGELVCVKPFPSRPVYFWGDKDDHTKYKAAYFNYYDKVEVWRHGDFIEFTEAGGILVHGRSDATLNPGGVRIGTAEIYKELEKLDWIEDSVVVERFEPDDSFIVLMCKLSENEYLDDARVSHLSRFIREKLSPRHVPKFIFAVKDIPYTRSGKKSEIAVKCAINHEPIANTLSLSNPECLGLFEQLAEKLDAVSCKS